ncbi:glycerol-3-phosphate dehydrogenase [Saprolegnia parasitica CBS 223.65]|uniref:Glycerol-3-phosphate dehydrogenase [NAD(+)] n=1 Tax=Saprolegnia parasitica (strain CBS 223.65) TaxID=695850 RepID=A0A067D8S7_SAPPC|nr:glycerol-3-phosphate dehydrogenase [Saprolegnia parasitica CBS 223.65]KDO35417.1 glycerol-3-phosphate dehydrogenase [Saprolegnia parasitica CBS 223.65]|eukprot:XP_012193757.1 glycerol-3-phosphate dehydrogenase [Saprolegnia parasitica CBS 223.65]
MTHHTYHLDTHRKKVVLVGSGNWGSAIARIVGDNITANPQLFEPTLNMWVFEEMVNERKLTEIINTEHENVKYLPGYKLPTNVVAVPDLKEATKGAHILIFCVPHQFLGRMLPQIKEQGLESDCCAVSLIKGIDFNDNGVVLVSNIIRDALNIDCSVLMGANVANEVAAGDFCESTLGCSGIQEGALLQHLFHAPTFHVNIAMDPNGVELCGALKNVVALGAGFCDGLGYGGNTKAAIIRLGLIEMKKFCYRFFDGIKEDTFFESCGVADLITTCFGGRNRKCAELFVKDHGVTWETLENTVLNGQKLQGTWTAKEVFHILDKTNALNDFPLFVAIYRIAFEGANPKTITTL